MRSTCSPRTGAPRSVISATTQRPSSATSPRRSRRRRSVRRSRSMATSHEPTRCSRLRSAPSRSREDPTKGWRSDYGSSLRDGAAVLTLASEARSGIDLVSLSTRVEQQRVTRRYTSTQEDAWSLMAAHALMESLSEPKLAVDGELISGPLFRGLDAGQPRDRADDDRESRRPSDRGRRHRARCSADARAGRRQLSTP